MIDSNIGNPNFQIELIKEFISRYSLDNFLSYNVPIDYLKYQFDDFRKYDDIIRNFYSQVLQNPIPQDKAIIIGTGTNGTSGSVYWAISQLMKKSRTDPLKIYQINKPPTYDILYKSSLTIPNCVYGINGLNGLNELNELNELNGLDSLYDFDTEIKVNKDNCDISTIISPNNPTGEIIDERYGQFQIVDSVYDTFLFTGQNTFINKEITGNDIFIKSLSKYGFASYRFGWAITSDSRIATLANKYAKYNHNGLITPNYFASEKVLNTFEQDSFYHIFSNTCYNILNSRKRLINNLLIKHNIFLSDYNQKYIPFSFLPLSRNKLMEIGIDARPGKDFLFSNNFSRLNLMMDINDFNMMYSILDTKLHTIID